MNGSLITVIPINILHPASYILHHTSYILSYPKKCKSPGLYHRVISNPRAMAKISCDLRIKRRQAVWTYQRVTPNFYIFNKYPSSPGIVFINYVLVGVGLAFGAAGGK